ncbi:FKBP-type peptidyl-prolyl cis-trans isomerase [Polaribacter septentrionalilitoris]|uniref:FKBP-type peptidyl-prolyl cis-trans isomerase n=1 Tax=Polaribacter septentrionalilitoris TaxID=2494657 RepID=UPI00135B6F28|nr:FKBP-type peptidyl-prolyl cis-trans isomerase [Polaribacter septentrionalilitoris]
MNKIKNIFALLIISLVFFSCGDNNNGIVFDNFDHEGQALIDNDSLTQFLKNFYFDSSTEAIKPMVAGQTSLADDTSGNLKTLNVTENDIDYTMYIYVIDRGGKDASGNIINAKGSPSVVDSVFAKYKGQRIVRNDSIGSVPFDQNESGIWFTLDGVIRGWTYGISDNLEGGKNITNNGPITYENFGKGILIIPSGLAYRNSGTDGIPPNENLIFYVSLLDFVKGTDHDNDGKASIDEDADGDGDPRNDFSDEDFPSTPDYLNSNVN